VPWDRKRAIAAALVLLTSGAATGVATAQAPAPSDPAPSETSTTAGPSAIDDPQPRGELDSLGVLLMGRHASMPPVQPPPFFKDAPANTPSGPPYKTGPSDKSPVVIPPPALGPGDGTIYAVGDSVLLGTENVLPTTTAGWDLRMDAQVGRTFPGGITVFDTNRASVGQVAVVVLGHNYGGGNLSAGYIDHIMADLQKAQRVVWVTVTEWTPAQAEVNRNIYAAAARYPSIVVAPWAETVKANPDFLVDNVHPNATGRVALANLIAVMVGPVAPSDGRPKPPRPIILPLPPLDPTPTPTTTKGPTTTAPKLTTTTPAPTTTTVGTTIPPTTTTTEESTTTTTEAAPAGGGGGNAKDPP
jgi:hypothetical protein